MYIQADGQRGCLWDFIIYSPNTTKLLDVMTPLNRPPISRVYPHR